MVIMNFVGENDMNAYAYLSAKDLAEEKNKLTAKLDALKAKGISLDMSRGKPEGKQLDLAAPMLKTISEGSLITGDGVDCRNYGVPDGLVQMKQIFADMLATEPDEVITGNNSSLSMMYDAVARAMIFGVLGGEPWSKQKVKFLCPAPGYDRHFAICEEFGIEMITIAMTPEGPEMDEVERLVSSDASIKGIWCVPMYSNPEGIVYSDKVVSRFAALKPAAKDFRIFWDNAYCVHHLTDRHESLMPLLKKCKEQGSEDMVYMFASTSKISFGGAGVAAIAASKTNIACIRKQLSIRTIGPNKVNQLAHVKFFGGIDGVIKHMEKHAQILAPKFSAVLEMLDKELAPLGIGKWHKPNGGYFVSFNALEGCAKRIVELCKYAGVTLTSAGATYPYGKDPNDSNIRIAPTFPPVEELMQAMEIFCISVRLASVEKLLSK